jgi:hypothetical protein
MLLDEITRKALALTPSERRQLIGILVKAGIEDESRRKSAAELKSMLSGVRSLPGEPMSYTIYIKQLDTINLAWQTG